jgi:predicted lactoylglutathione lyase
MVKQLWINLPVKDVKKSKEFFTKLGFKFNEKFGGEPNSACLLIGEKEFVVMLFDEPTFKSFTGNEMTDTKLSNEVLFSIDAQSKEEVNEMALKVVEAGGKCTQPKDVQGWMYGFVFSDLDGHNWNILYMDMSKMTH